jgi:hypothetical protein
VNGVRIVSSKRATAAKLNDEGEDNENISRFVD